jgi:hypothetical protein
MLKAKYKEAIFKEYTTVNEVVEVIREFAEPYPIKIKRKLELEIEPRVRIIKNNKTGKEYYQLRCDFNLPKDFPKKKYKVTIEES